MKRTLFLVFISLLTIMAIITGCQPDSDEDEIEIRLAPIHEVSVNIAESYPPQVFVHIKGGLRDGCTTFHQLTTRRDDKTIDIEVTTQRPKDKACTQVYQYFEKNVVLGSDFTSGETYTVKVNDKMTTFVMQ